MRIPVLCLENKNASVKVGVSAFIELSEVGIKVHGIIDRDGPPIKGLIITFALGLALYVCISNRHCHSTHYLVCQNI